MHQSSIKLVTVLFLGLIHLIAAAEVELVKADRAKGGWFFFGHGVLDSGYDAESGELIMDVRWNHATWGIGGLFKLPNSR